MHCYQINLQTGWGGGEVYSRFFSAALAANGIPTTLFVHADNPHWRQQSLPGVSLRPLRGLAELAAALPAAPCWLLFHTPVGPEALAGLRRPGRLLTAMAHMPLYGRDPKPLAAYDRVIGVSRHVLNSLAAAGISAVHPEPLLGVASLDRLPSQREAGPLLAESAYDWDTRKLRDRLLGWGEPLYRRLLPRRSFQRGEGITLGLVSRLTPIKQFPLLFRHLAPVLARQPQFRLEIFGAGGYASVRDLKAALAPIRERVRFWGQQADVGRVYRQLDYLLTGLPEKEALGLNVLEAQACGTPVLAVDALPFSETVVPGVTGLLYRDPRQDAGADFERLLVQLQQQAFHIDPERAAPVLANFSVAAFEQRVARLHQAILSQGAA